MLQKGDLIVYPDFDVPPSQHESEIYFAVESRWLEQLSPQEFYGFVRNLSSQSEYS